MIYDVNVNKLAIEMLPPDKRYKGNIALIQSLLVPLQTARDSLFGTYYLGSSSVIGIKERLVYNGSNVVLEYALNRRYSTTFRIPPEVGLSDIYITNLNPALNLFSIGSTKGSSIGSTTSFWSIGETGTFTATANFTINVPIDVYNSTTEYEIRNFVDLYVNKSLHYNIQTY